MEDIKVGSAVALVTGSPFDSMGIVARIVDHGDHRPVVLVLDNGLRFNRAAVRLARTR